MPLTPNFTGSWNSSSTYNAGDLVTFQGTTWIANQSIPANKTPGVSPLWLVFAAQGAVGASINWRGPWNVNLGYGLRDAVTYNNCSFVCIAPTTAGIAPLVEPDIHAAVDPHWSMMAQSTPLIFKGDWVSNTQYFPYDVVEDAGSVYVALIGNIGDEPPSTNWFLMLSGGGGGGSFLPLTGGTITGDLTVTGDISATSGIVRINTLVSQSGQTLSIGSDTSIDLTAHNAHILIDGNGSILLEALAASTTVSLIASAKLVINVGEQINIVSVPIFANNAAAVTGGLAVGDVYRTGGDPDVLAIVH